VSICLSARCGCQVNSWLSTKSGFLAMKLAGSGSDCSSILYIDDCSIYRGDVAMYSEPLSDELLDSGLAEGRNSKSQGENGRSTEGMWARSSAGFVALRSKEGGERRPSRPCET
jgi:hypothetical protein